MDQAVSATVEIAQGKLQGIARDGVLRFNGIPFAKPPVGHLRWQHAAGARCLGRRPRRVALRQYRAAGGKHVGRRAGRHAGHALGRLSLSQHPDAGLRRRQARRDGVDPWRRVRHRRGQRRHLQRQVHRAARRHRARHDQLPLGAFGFLNLRDASDGKLPGTRRRRSRRPDRGAAMGEGQHRRVRRRSRQCDDLRRERRRHERRRAARGTRARAACFTRRSRNRARATSAMRARHRRRSRAMSWRSSVRRRSRSTRRGRSILDIQKELLAAPREVGLGMPFAPTIDGTILPKRAIECVAEGSAKGVPVMTGTTRDEWKLFTVAAANLRQMDEARLAQDDGAAGRRGACRCAARGL